MLNWFRNREKGSVSSYESNEDWIAGLQSPPDEHAVEKLRAVLVRGLKPALAKYVDRELDQFVEDVAQDALLKILDNIDSFRGESKFTTWAMKIAVREGLTELRRKRYDDISLNDLAYDGEDAEIRTISFSGNDPKPDRTAHETLLLEKVMNLIEHELTDKQKQAIDALLVHDLPVSVVAEQMNTNRNALYKLLHDARLKLKNRFEVEGIDLDEMLNEL